MADIGTFDACLDISIFLLRKGADGKIAALAPRDGLSYAFTFLSDGTKSWSDDTVWESLREQTRSDSLVDRSDRRRASRDLVVRG